MKDIIVENRIIGENHFPYFIADIGANHDGDLNRAYKLIELAKLSGAHAAKFQNFQASKIVSKVGFEKLGGKMSHQSNWKKSVYQVYEEASVSFEWTEKLKKRCNEVGIHYFTSPYDFSSVDHVDEYVNLYKIGSGDITWIEMVEYIASKQKPVLIAAGASDMSDVVRAVNVLKELNSDIVLMQCNTNYTGDEDNFNYINLNVLKTFKIAFPNTILGLSDHTVGHSTVLGAIALGARVIEKHFTDDNSRVGPDHKFAMNPISWREMIERSSELFNALGDGVKRVEKNEIDSMIVQRRCIRINRDITLGEELRKEDLEVLRPIPADGIPPYEVDKVIGKKVLKNLLKGDYLTYNLLG